MEDCGFEEEHPLERAAGQASGLVSALVPLLAAGRLTEADIERVRGEVRRVAAGYPDVIASEERGLDRLRALLVEEDAAPAALPAR